MASFPAGCGHAQHRNATTRCRAAGAFGSPRPSPGPRGHGRTGGPYSAIYTPRGIRRPAGPWAGACPPASGASCPRRRARRPSAATRCLGGQGG
eukprot:scaffold89753_cov57-Phaeocystis_antarctica.AAC.2